MVSGLRHFESSFSTVEWLLEDHEDDLTDEQLEALVVYHELLREFSQDQWGVEPPKLPEKVGEVPRHPDFDENA